MELHGLFQTVSDRPRSRVARSRAFGARGFSCGVRGQRRRVVDDQRRIDQNRTVVGDERRRLQQRTDRREFVDMAEQRNRPVLERNLRAASARSRRGAHRANRAFRSVALGPRRDVATAMCLATRSCRKPVWRGLSDPRRRWAFDAKTALVFAPFWVGCGGAQPELPNLTCRNRTRRAFFGRPLRADIVEKAVKYSPGWGKLAVFRRRVGRVVWPAPGPPSWALCGEHYRKHIHRP